MLLDDSFRRHVEANLRAFEVQSVPVTTHHAAAVALALCEEGEGAQVAGLARPESWSKESAFILTKRALSLANHAGQWALPGGRIDLGETAEDAALRELHEEVGLALGRESVLGTLDDYVTRSGFSITPVVVWAGAAPALVPNPAEVAAIHRITITEFMREDAPLLDAIEDSVHPVLRMPVGTHWIAAPTAAFLYQFREVCVAGRKTRVAHFEQPLFARK